VDSFTHGLLAFYLLSLTGLSGGYLIAVVIGAIFPDIDILFLRLSSRSPRFFIFTHGGFTHSLTGTFAIAGILTVITVILSRTGLPVPEIGLTLFSAYLAGSLVHVGLDILAYPGIPVFYPFSSRKYTLGIFPGPSLLIFAVTIVFLTLVVLGIQSLMYPFFYLAIVMGVITFRALMKVLMAIFHEGITIPRMNPFHWFIIHEYDDIFVLESYHMLGKTESLGEYPRYTNITKEELAPFLDTPEVRRHLYYSYISVAERKEDGIVFLDPLREKKFIWYPPDYAYVKIPLQAIDSVDDF
jgi:inner membrane protein